MLDCNTIINDVKILSLKIRKHIFDMALVAESTSSHLGGALSIVEICATLFGTILNYDVNNPNWTERDRLILSKGHGCLAYYAGLAEVGFIPIEDLKKFEQNNSDLAGHPIMNRNKGIEFTNGSLGMGLSLGIGVALSGKKRNRKYRVFVILGDGECNEGAVWEAAMAAPHFELDNLVAIVDYNGLQQTGKSNEIMSTLDLASKWHSFGWEVSEIDGHNISQLHDNLNIENKLRKPKIIIAHTIKGKGFKEAENNNDWHHKVLTKKQYKQAIEELNLI